MKKETFIEKKIALKNIKAMMAKSMYLLTASEKMELGMTFIDSAKEDMDGIEQEAKEKGSTEWANLPERDIQVTPSMMRRAIEKALALEVTDGRGRKRRVFSTKKKWLAVYRVLQYFGIVDGSTQYQRALNYIMNKVYPKGVPMPEAMKKIMPNTTALSKAGGESGLNKQLEEWLSGKYDEQLDDYLPIAQCIVKSITDEMLPYPQKA